MEAPTFVELMRIFSVPRPNGSRAERETQQRIQNWLEARNVQYRVQPFPLYPYYFELIGIWLILSYLCLSAAVFFRSGLWASLIVVLALLGSAFSHAAKIHLVTWIGRTRGMNFLLEFGPGEPRVKQEIVISAHYDSKSEPLDHRQRMFYLKSLQTGILLSIFLAILAPLDRWLFELGSAWSGLSYAAGILLSLAVIILASGYGLNLALGRIAPQSTGAVDNGAACAILLALAERLAHGSPLPPGMRVTLAVFGGEEVDRQGSRAYVKSRGWPHPTCALNLEVMAQNGEYVYWEEDGTIFKLLPTDRQVNATVGAAVKAITGTIPRPVGPVLSDGGPFIAAGIPAAVLGTYDRQWVDTGFHSPADNLDRIVLERLPEALDILTRFIELCPNENPTNVGPFSDGNHPLY